MLPETLTLDSYLLWNGYHHHLLSAARAHVVRFQICSNPVDFEKGHRPLAIQCEQDFWSPTVSLISDLIKNWTIVVEMAFSSYRVLLWKFGSVLVRLGLDYNDAVPLRCYSLDCIVASVGIISSS